MRRTRKSARLRLEKVTLRILTSDEASAVVGGGSPHGPKQSPVGSKHEYGRELSRNCLDYP